MANDHSRVNILKPKIMIYGGTGLAKMLRETVEYYGCEVIAVFDDTPELTPPFKDIPLYKGKEFENWIVRQDKSDLGFLIAIANPHGEVRLKFHERFINEGLTPITVAHYTAWVARDAEIGAGTHIDAGAIVMAQSTIGRQCIIGPNTNIAHDDVLEDIVDTTVGVTICGNVFVRKNVWIGAGSIILPRINIGCDAVVGAGAVVNKDVSTGTTVVGMPARPIAKK